MILSDSNVLASYFGDALESENLTTDFCSFIDTCFKDSEQGEALSECIYEAIETTFGIRTSV